MFSMYLRHVSAYVFFKTFDMFLALFKTFAMFLASF
jgi:hypothetical protein